MSRTSLAASASSLVNIRSLITIVLVVCLASCPSLSSATAAAVDENVSSSVSAAGSSPPVDVVDMASAPDIGGDPAAGGGGSAIGGISGGNIVEHMFPFDLPLLRSVLDDNVLKLLFEVYDNVLGLSSFTNFFPSYFQSLANREELHEHQQSLVYFKNILILGVLVVFTALIAFLLYVDFIAFRYVYRCLFAPLNDDFVDVYEKRQREEQGKKFVKRKRGELPPPYPNGWFCVMHADDLKKGKPQYVQALGLHLAVYRGNDDGKPRAVDAYCPHLGANLGYGGHIKGNCIECPFHGWRFDGDNGKCVKIAYSDANIPELAKTKAYHCVERNKLILVWHHSDDIEPAWTPPDITHVEGVDYIFHGRTAHRVSCHVQEIPENGPDKAHLNYLHTPFIIDFLPLEHQWTAEWDHGTEEHNKHIGMVDLTQSLTIFGRHVPGSNIKVTVEQIGPGLTYLFLETMFGRLRVIEAVCPIAPLMQRCVHVIFGENTLTLPRLLCKGFMKGFSVQFERDIPIWNKKTYVHKPLLVKGDGRIVRYRRWFKNQFYTENSRGWVVEDGSW